MSATYSVSYAPLASSADPRTTDDMGEMEAAEFAARMSTLVDGPVMVHLVGADWDEETDGMTWEQEAVGVYVGGLQKPVSEYC